MSGEAPTAEQIAAQQAELDRSRKLIEKAWSDPTLRPALRKHVKDLFPDRHLVDDDVEAATAPLRSDMEKIQKQNEELLAALKKRDEDDAKARKEREDATFAEKMESARREYNLTDEGFELMKKRMLDTHAFDPQAAAAYIVSQTPPSLPAGPLYGSASLNFANSAEASDDARYKILHSGLDGPAKYLEAEIRDCFGPNGKDYVAKEMGKTYADLAFAR
jgi:hypothetical protein